MSPPRGFLRAGPCFPFPSLQDALPGPVKSRGTGRWPGVPTRPERFARGQAHQWGD